MPTTSIWQSEVPPLGVSRELPASADVVVVGAGLLGVSTAYWLKREDPNLDVVLLDAERVAHGASGRNAGFLLQGSASDARTDLERYGAKRMRRLWQLTRENAELIASELDPAAFDHRTRGSFTVAGDADEESRLRESGPLLHAFGVSATFLPADDLNRRLGSRQFYGGLWMPDNAEGHPAKLVRHIAERSSTAIVEDCRVLDIRPAGSSLVASTESGASIEAPRVVLAMNAYLPNVSPEFADTVRPVRAQMLSTEPVSLDRLPAPIYSHEGYFYLRQRADGRLVLGGARHLHRHEEVGYADTTTPALQADLEAYLAMHFP
ncbi:MAG: FAD-binding oxidoreductase, partial [Bacteroidota bacterium]